MERYLIWKEDYPEFEFIVRYVDGHGHALSRPSRRRNELDNDIALIKVYIGAFPFGEMRPEFSTVPGVRAFYNLYVVDKRIPFPRQIQAAEMNDNTIMTDLKDFGGQNPNNLF